MTERAGASPPDGQGNEARESALARFIRRLAATRPQGSSELASPPATASAPKADEPPTPPIQLEVDPARPLDAIVLHRGSHLQVIACAGAGKTEAIAQRVVGLIAEGAPPNSIVAFTFTDRAAQELKDRIVRRTAEFLGSEQKGRISPMFVGTIHAYCHRLLQDHVPKYGNFDVLDPNRHAGFLSREHYSLGLNSLGLTGHWEPIRAFSEMVDVIGNELIAPEALDAEPLGAVYRKYLDALDRYHCLTFSRIIQLAVEALDDPKVFDSVHGSLRHLIVDEYQDINPAQEALIRKLGRAPVSVCVVGDDDQAIYQWRGSDVSHIRDFQRRFPGARTVTLAKNRRSRRAIVDLSATFAQSIPNRLPKSIDWDRETAEPCVVPWSAATPTDEAQTIARAVLRLREKGFRFRDIAVLHRSVSTGAPPLIDAFRAAGIPYACAGRTGLFLQPEVAVFARTYQWLADRDWRPPGFGQQPLTADSAILANAFVGVFAPSQTESEIRALLDDWKATVTETKKPVDLIEDYYRVLQQLGVHRLDPDDPIQAARLGSLARFSNILADYENVARRGRWVDKDSKREFTGGRDRDETYYRNLANFIQNYAQGGYDEFEGEEHRALDAVDIVTVHGAKGLEWKVVFLPGLKEGRFPSSNAGRTRNWLLPLDAFPADARRRYEGGDSEERRLFYVAITRAKDVLYISQFQRQKNRTRPSPYLGELFPKGLPQLDDVPVPDDAGPAAHDSATGLHVSFSDLRSFEDCGHRHRLAHSLGFETQLASELGYGRAIHHVLRQVAETSRATGTIPSEAEVKSLLDREFYLPFANRANFENLRESAWRLVKRYLGVWREDLARVWALERSFELHVEGGIVSGRADVILDHHDGEPDSLAIVDYKTSKGHGHDDLFAFQLAVYAAAGRAEGLRVDAAFLHHLDEGARSPSDISAPAVVSAVRRAESLVAGLRSGAFEAKPEGPKCKRCEYRRLCRHAPSDPWDGD